MYALRKWVAPHAGAWIETVSLRRGCARLMSHPMRVRGLKLALLPELKETEAVAPHAGAWIETVQDISASRPYLVAPHAGAWIETTTGTEPCIKGQVAPHAGAWIETEP